MLSTKKIITKYRFLFMFIILITYFLTRAINYNEIFYSLNSLIFFGLILYSLFIIGSNKTYLYPFLFIFGVSEIIISTLFGIYKTPIYDIFNIIFSLILYLFMSYECLNYTFKDKIITQSTLFGALCAYLFIGQCFTSIYLLIYQLNTSAFSGLTASNVNSDLIYFSFVTITTLGYGDILPISKLAKTLTWMESYTGQAYLTILMALLVGRFINQKQ